MRNYVLRYKYYNIKIAKITLLKNILKPLENVQRTPGNKFEEVRNRVAHRRFSVAVESYSSQNFCGSSQHLYFDDVKRSDG